MNTPQHRQDTQGCQNQIFLNSAGCSLMPKVAHDAMINYFQNENLVGGYELAKVSEPEISKFYTEVGKLLNCKPTNIAYTNSATDAYSKALSAIDFKKNDVILTTKDDYVSNQLTFISLQKRFEIKIIYAEKLENNELDFIDFEQKIINLNPKLIAVTHIPTNTGLVQNVQKVGELCQKYDILFLLDACQSVGQINVDVQKIKCDFLTATGRKFLRGPRGTGFLYVSDKAVNLGLEPLFIDLQGATWSKPNLYTSASTAQRFESWEKSYGLILGLTESLKYLNDIGIENIQKYNKIIAAYFRQKLSEIPEFQIMDFGTELSNIITVYPKHSSLETIIEALNQHHICFSIATKNNALFDFESKKVDWVIRFSPHYFNTENEIDLVINVLKTISSR